MNSILLDASALLCLINQEPGADKVAAVLDNASISTVNLAEVYSKLHEAGMPEEEIAATIEDSAITVVPFDQTCAYVTGQLRCLTRALGLSLGDRACLATGKFLGLAVMTTDKAWLRLDIGVEILCVR